MIKKFTIVCLFIQAFTLSLSAQTVLTYEKNAMHVADVLSLKTLDTISAGNAGANQVWDYSKAKIGTDFVINYNANPGELYIPGNAFACNENNERNSFFQITTDKKLYYGLSTPTTDIRFDEPLVELSFPFQYQSEITGEMKGTYTQGGISAPIIGTYKTIADAWGTIILPNGMKLKDVLRVKSTRTYKHDIMGAAYNISVTRYAFYSKNSRYAVLQIKEATITCDCGCNSKEYGAYFNPTVKAECEQIEETKPTANKTKFEYKAYPNPFEGEIRVDYKLDSYANIELSILDLQGKEIKKVEEDAKGAGTYSILVDLNGGHSQNYILQIKVNDVLYTEKLIKKQKGRK